MPTESFFKGMDISASGLHAEWVRMQVVANNVANADTTRTPAGGPYRRQHVIFSTVMGGLNGVTVAGVTVSNAPPRMVYQPDHPEADKETGMLAMPNIKVPLEMIDLMTASRAYEANLTALRNYKSILEEAVRVLRS
jgi:flagellar basal-body rod protein FlgC